MNKLWKKLLVVSTTTALLVQMTIAPDLADGRALAAMDSVAAINNTAATVVLAQNAQTAITLEAAIKKVKGIFAVPEDLKYFSSGFSSYNGRQVWSLNWSSLSGGSFNAQVDADNGDILNINNWYDSSDKQSDSVTREEAAKIANDLLKRLLGDRFNNLKFIEDTEQIVPLRTYGETQYSFRWQRYHNQLPVIGDLVTVQVSSKDGRVSYYNLSWSKAELPAADKVISQGEAVKAFADSGMLELKYYLPGYFYPLATGEKRDISLVYELAYKNANGAIDALTGKPVKFEMGEWTELNGDGIVRDSAELSANKTMLTPEELKEIDQNEKLISQEEAIAVVKQYVEFPQNMVLRHVSLNKDWQTNERIWNFEWVSKQQDNAQKYLSARVNALTKELWGFNLSDPALDLTTGAVLSRDEARKIGETFLQRVQPERFKQVKERTEDVVTIMESKVEVIEPVAQPLSFTYERVVNGLRFPNNYMQVVVSPVSRQVTSFNLYWGNYNFPSTDGVLNMDSAVNSYLKGRPLTLSYLKVYQDGQTEGMKLVYIPFNLTGMPETNIIDAKTGEHLNYQGKPLSDDPKPLTFNDIAGDKAEQEIAKLGKAGAFGEYGSSFRPNENITLASLLRASLIAENGPYGFLEKTDAEIIKAAKERGWLTQDEQAGKQVTRQELATLMVRILNLDKIASLEGLYNLNFEDAGKISPKAAGHVALANALKLIESDGSFRPEDPVTRSDAALAIVRTINTLDNR